MKRGEEIREKKRWVECRRCWNANEDDDSPMCEFCLQEGKAHQF